MRLARVANLSKDGSDASESNNSVCRRVNIRQASLIGMGTFDSESLLRSSFVRQPYPWLWFDAGFIDTTRRVEVIAAAVAVADEKF